MGSRLLDRTDPASSEPQLFGGEPRKRFDTGFRTTQGPAYPFLKQNDANPKNKDCPHQTCKYQQHSKKFLCNVETHFRTPLDGCSYDSFRHGVELSKVPMEVGFYRAQ
jgi:hypothetical protein